jgi:MraZ protein
MFVGQYDHSLDDKGRVVVPSPFRAFVDNRAFVTRLDGCIGLWGSDDFRDVAKRWKSEMDGGNVSSRVFRKLMSGVREVKLDAAGRITLPRELLDEFGFVTQVVVAGRYDRVEIWPAERYADQLESDEASEELAETVARLGI